MGRNTQSDGAPIDGSTVTEIADEWTAPEIDEYPDGEGEVTPEMVRAILDAGNDLCARSLDMMRDEAKVVAETDDLVVLLSDYGFQQEDADAVREEVGDALSERADYAIGKILSEAHHAAFKSARVRALTGYDETQVAGATGASYPYVIRKAESDRPDADAMGLDEIEYRIRYERPTGDYQFNAGATATIQGDMGTVRVRQRYRAIPDPNSGEDHDTIRVERRVTHVESETDVEEETQEWSLDEQVNGPTYGRIDQWSPDLRRWVHDHFTADLELDYELGSEPIPTCDNCGAYPHPGRGIYVDQRDTRQHNPSRDDSLCTYCFEQVVDAMTTLSAQEAEVYALKDSGLTNKQVSETIEDVSQSHVGTVVGRIREKVDEAGRTADLRTEW